MKEKWEIVCRLCLSDDVNLNNLFVQQEERYFPELIKESIRLEISEDDELPPNICDGCVTKIEFIHSQRKIFFESDKKLREMLVDSRVEKSNEIAFVDILPSQTDEESDDLQKKDKSEEQPTNDVPISYPRINDHKCYICSEKCGTAQSLADHLSKHIDQLPFKCGKCVREEVIIKSLSTLNAHLKMHAQPVKCNFCDKSYSSFKNKKLHEQNYHLKTDDDKSPIVCLICQKECPSKSSHKSHMKTHTNEYQCKTCQKSFGSQRNLTRHEAIHTQQKSYECSICGNKYTQMINYNVHMKRHNNERPHECKLCPAKFVVSSDLKYHIKSHHSDKVYVPRRNLKDHYTVKRNDESKKRIFECNICQKMFSSGQSITSHISTHFKSYQCTYCGQIFKNAFALKDHENTHTGAKPYDCKICGKSFASSSTFYQHNKIHTGVKNYKCEVCDKLFTYKENMKAHIRVHHTKEKPFECVMCNKKFMDNSSFKKHKQMHTDLPVDNFGVDWYNEYG